MDKQGRQKLFSEYLNKMRLTYIQKRGRVVSFSEIAREVGITQASMSQYVIGARLPTGDNLYKLCKYCAELMGENTAYDILDVPVPQSEDPMVKRILSIATTLNREQLEQVISFAQKLAQ